MPQMKGVWIKTPGMKIKTFAFLLTFFLLLNAPTFAFASEKASSPRAVNPDAAGTAVNLAGSKINILEITEQTPGTVLVLDRETTVSTLIVNAPATISGEGTVETALVNVDGVCFDMVPAAALYLAEGVTVVIGSKEISAPKGAGLFIDYSIKTDTTVAVTYGDIPSPVLADLIFTGCVGIVPDDAGEAAGKIFAGYKLAVDDHDVSLAGDDVAYIRVKTADREWEYITAGAEGFLWFDLEEATGRHEFEVKSSEGRVFFATLAWQEEIKAIALQASDGDEFESGTGASYVKLEVKDNDEQPSLTAGNIELIAQRTGEKWVELELDPGGTLCLNDGSLWFKKDQETGRYEFFVVTNGEINGGTIYRAALEWTVPETIESATIKQLAAGLSHSLALKTGGTVWAWGFNGSGQLGDGTTVKKFTPVRAGVQLDDGDEKLIDIEAIAAGHSHSLALKDDGTVWAWGINTYGQLGDGAKTNKSTPVQVGRQVSDFTGVQAITAGHYHSLALETDGTVWAWGRNNYGQLGDGMAADKSSPVQVVFQVGDQIDKLTGVRTVAAGYYHSLVLKDDGTVWAWGLNNKGQLGNGTTADRSSPVQVGVRDGDRFDELTDVQAIAAGSYHVLALKTDGTVWAWGRNNKGQLGDGMTADKSSPVQVVLKVGDQIDKLTDVRAIAAGYDHSFAITNDGTVWVWGCNNFGQLGNGKTTNNITPVQVSEQLSNLANLKAIAAGSNHSLALADDLAFAWGNNADGQLGAGTLGADTATFSSIPVQVAFE